MKSDLVPDIRPVICTIIASNYLAQARVLAASFFAQHPSGICYVLVIDKPDGRVIERNELFKVIAVTDLTNLKKVLVEMVSRYDVRELATAVKPYWLEYLHTQYGHDRVLYFDPDIRLYGSLRDLWNQLALQNMILTPHLLGPLTDAHVPNEWWILRAGTYNLGFLGVHFTPDTVRIMQWWQQRLIKYAHNKPTAFQHFDQKWMDLVPGFLPNVVIERSAGLNVAFWDLPNRAVAGFGDQYTVNGQPLFFWHFSGYDPDHPDQISRHQDRYSFTDLPVLQSIFTRYQQELLQHGYTTTSRWSYQPVVNLKRRRLGWDGGSALRFYDAIVRVFERLGIAPEVQRLLGPRVIHRVRRLVARVTKKTGRKQVLPFGATIVGYFGHQGGMGEVARTTTLALQSQQLPVSWIPADGLKEYPRSESLTVARARYNTWLLLLNADVVGAMRQRLPYQAQLAEHVVGFWQWELAEFPATWHEYDSIFDEIWVASEFVRASVSAGAKVPVATVGLAVEPGAAATLNRDAFHIPEHKFMFLTIVDLGHFPERKNPFAVIEAFRVAFGDASPAALLVIKIIHSNKNPEWARRLKAAVKKINGIVIDTFLSRAELNALYLLADAYVSLHRGEGFGLTMAEAMYFKKPVIATNYGGVTDFLYAGTGWPVTYELVPIGAAMGPYPAGASWAGPSIASAAAAMVQVMSQPAEVALRVARAHRLIIDQYSYAAVGHTMAQRLHALSHTAFSLPVGSGTMTFADGMRMVTTVVPHPFFVNIGACDGVSNDPLYGFIKRYGLAGLLIEPDPDNFQLLQENYRHIPNVSFVQAAIGEHEGELTMWRVAPTMGGLPWWHNQVISFNQEVVKSVFADSSSRGLEQQLVEQQVPTFLLQQILDDQQVQKIDILHIDAEGYDFKILKQLDWQRYQPWLIRYEHVNLSLTDQAACRALLTARGYTVTVDDIDTFAYRLPPVG